MSDMAPPPAPAPDMSGRPGPASDNSKLMAALGYPIWIVALIMLLIDPYKNEKFVKFHAIQGLATGIGGWIACFVISIFLGFLGPLALLSPLLYLALLVYLIILATKAYKGEYFEVPIVYGIIKSYVGE